MACGVMVSQTLNNKSEYSPSHLHLNSTLIIAIDGNGSAQQILSLHAEPSALMNYQMTAIILVSQHGKCCLHREDESARKGQMIITIVSCVVNY